MKELRMDNGDVVDAPPECPGCGRLLASNGADEWACYNCQERYLEGDA